MLVGTFNNPYLLRVNIRPFMKYVLSPCEVLRSVRCTGATLLPTFPGVAEKTPLAFSCEDDPSYPRPTMLN